MAEYRLFVVNTRLKILSELRYDKRPSLDVMLFVLEQIKTLSNIDFPISPKHFPKEHGAAILILNRRRAILLGLRSNLDCAVSGGVYLPEYSVDYVINCLIDEFAIDARNYTQRLVHVDEEGNGHLA